MKPNDFTQALSVPVLYEKLVPGSGVEEICASVTVSAHLNCRSTVKMCYKYDIVGLPQLQVCLFNMLKCVTRI